MNTTKGFSTITVLVIAAIVIIVGFAAYNFSLRKAPAAEQPTSQVPTSDEATAVPLDRFGCYLKQGSMITNHGTAIAGADAVTFQDFSEAAYGLCIGKDARRVYHDGAVIAEADAPSFSFLWYTKYGDHLAVFGRSGPSILAIIYGTSAANSFQSAAIIPDSDAATFRALDGGYDISPWAADKNNVYCGGAAIAGADAATARVAGSVGHPLLHAAVNGVVKTYDSECRAQ